MYLILLALLTLILPDTTRIQGRDNPDTTGSITPVPSIQSHLRFFPTSIYTSSQGIGIGLGVDFDNVGRPGTLLQLAARPAQHRGIYTATFFTADPFRARTYGMVRTEYMITSRQRYYGVGPSSRKDGKISLQKESFEAEARVGFHDRSRHWLIQPTVRLQHHFTYGFTEEFDDSFESLDPRSQENLLFSVSDRGDLVTGLAPGLEIEYDRRDNPDNPRRGYVFTTAARRFFSVTSLPLTYDTYTAGAYGFIPMPGKESALSLRSLLVLTRNRGDSMIPFYMLPTLDRELMPGLTRNRYFGNDLLLFTAEYRHYLFTMPVAGRIQGTLALSAGNAYDDVFRQFRPGITMASEPALNESTYPLRPTIAVGGRVLSPKSGRLRLEGSLGFSPEGYSVVTFRFVQDLRKTKNVVR